MPAWIGRGCVKYLIRAESSLRETIDGRPTNPPPPPSRAYPSPHHYHPSYHRCLLHLLLSFPPSLPASTMTRGAIMSTSFQDSFTPSFESYRSSSSYLSFPPLCSTKSSFARLYSSFSSGYPPCPLILPR